MPIEIVRNTIIAGNGVLGAALLSQVKTAMETTATETTKEIRSRQQRNEFWNNQSGNALDSISGEAGEEGDLLVAAVGFEDGKPNEKDAGDFYNGRDHEYAEYIADRNQLGFTGSIQQALVRNLSNAMNNIGASIEVNTEQATRVKDGE